MKRPVFALTFLLVVTFALSGLASAQTGPVFKLGFKVLADQIPDTVGRPLENEHYGANGDSLQQTTAGLMVWRKADSWTAFTDGGRTWINGPLGVQSRFNDERLPWEFKRQIGDLEGDSLVIYNHGSALGVIDSTTAGKSWPDLVAARKTLAPNDRFEVHFYDDANKVPRTDVPQYFSPIIGWAGDYGQSDGYQQRFQDERGVWQWHLSLPYAPPEKVRDISNVITANFIYFFVIKNSAWEEAPQEKKADLTPITTALAPRMEINGQIPENALLVVTVPKAYR